MRRGHGPDIGALMLATADIGTEHGLSFAVYLRAPFGIHAGIDVLGRGQSASQSQAGQTKREQGVQAQFDVFS